jgi:hypothetical protein
LLCEVCSAKCQKCGKLVCPEHVHKTHSGKILCLPCQEKRRADYEARKEGKAGAEPGADLEAGAEAEEEEEFEQAALVVSVRKPPPPWKLSLYTACAGVALTAVVLLFPNLRRFTLPWGGYFSTPYLLLLIPLVSIFWGVVGMLTKEHRDDRPRCLIGMGVAVLSIVMMILAVFTDPARLAEAEASRVQNVRDKMTPEQLKQWREEKLQKFNR